MRVSSLTWPSSMGTLKSTRTRTRLPCGIEVADGELVHGVVPVRLPGVGAWGGPQAVAAADSRCATNAVRSATRQL